MINKIQNTTYVSGSLYKNEKISDIIKNIIQYLDGYKDLKLYLDLSNKYLPIINIVIMMNKQYEVMDVLDGTLVTVIERIEDEFKFASEKVFIYFLWK